MQKPITVELIGDMVGRPLNEEETKVVNWLSGWERTTQETITGLMLQYGSKCRDDAKNEKYVPSDRDKQTLDFLLEFNSDQKIALLGFLINRLYNNRDFHSAIRDAIEALYKDPILDDDVQTKH